VGSACGGGNKSSGNADHEVESGTPKADSASSFASYGWTEGLLPGVLEE